MPAMDGLRAAIHGSLGHSYDEMRRQKSNIRISAKFAAVKLF
jgi:hypothetical protein